MTMILAPSESVSSPLSIGPIIEAKYDFLFQSTQLERGLESQQQAQNLRKLARLKANDEDSKQTCHVNEIDNWREK